MVRRLFICFLREIEATNIKEQLCLLLELHVELLCMQGPAVGENSPHLEKTNLAGGWGNNGLTGSLVHGRLPMGHGSMDSETE